MAKIWFQEYKVEQWQHITKGNMLEHLGIEITSIGDDSLEGIMPIDHRTVQPQGILHGGASVVLAESLGSIASNMIVDFNQFACVGLDINANHIRPVSKGKVRGVAKAIHIGKKTHVWGIEIFNEENKLVCISRLTMAVIEK
jgi:1,4-dihydroxy-2-naphthoyl-CoA hydrolase